MKVFRFVLHVLGIPLGVLTTVMLWKWFIVPFGIIELSIPHALGMNGTIGWFTYQIRWDEELTEEQKMYKAVGRIVLPLICLGFGYIYQLFM